MVKPQLIIEASPEQEVLDYWREKSETSPRSRAVIQAYLKRIRARLGDGYSVAELKRAVDVACWDQFYTEHGYHKQPEVIFRSEVRIDTLLHKGQREADRMQARLDPYGQYKHLWDEQ